MTYEHYEEMPFHWFLVKNDSRVIGVIRRNLRTGEYQYYDDVGSLKFKIKETSIERLKRRIEMTTSARGRQSH